MAHNQNLHLLKSYTRQIPDCQSDFHLMKESVDQMYKLFYPITGIGISENQTDILLSSGKAISPSAAAHCLLEMKRTAITENDRLICFEGEKPPFDRISLGNVFKVNREKLDIKYLRNTLPLPDETSSYPELKLFTSIRVFGDETLGENDCSLNLSLKYYDFRAHTGKAVEFWYEQEATPGIRCKLEGNELIISKPGKYPRPDYFKLWQEQQSKLLKNEILN